jgi:formyl-CoA transferase
MTQSGPLTGVRVVEVAAWTFVPAAAAVLADLGAEVIKVEPPSGDPQRALNIYNLTDDTPNPFLELPNRGKRSIALNLAEPDGRQVLLELAGRADVFITSYLPAVRAKLGIDVGDLRQVRPDIVYAIGSGWGRRGSMADSGGFDMAAGWATSGLAYRLTAPGGEPPMQPPAFFDLQGSTALAGAISTALFKRERTGEGSLVDVSLLNVGMWTMSPDIVGAPYADVRPPTREEQRNPLVNTYLTKDDRWLCLVLLQSDRYWGELCALIDAIHLVVDDRFIDADARAANSVACIRALDEVFAKRSLTDWKAILADFSGVWAPLGSAGELHSNPQVLANEFLPTISTGESSFRLVSVPMRFDDSPSHPKAPAPGLGAHTDAILRDLGYDDQRRSALRDRGVIA